MKSPNQDLLNRNVHTLIEPRLTNAVRLIEKCVNYGTDLIATFNRETQFENSLPAIMLGLHAIETLDAIGVLVARCCNDPAAALLRMQVETLFSIRYMAEADSERRAIQYLVAHAHSRIDWYRKLDPTTETGKQLSAQIGKDGAFANIDVVSRNTDSEVRNLLSMLARPEYAEVEGEWQRIRAQKKGKPWWYSLFGGPSSIEALATSIGEQVLYQLVYRQYSEEIHGTNVIGSLHVSHDRRPQFQPIRYPPPIPTTCNMAVAIMLYTFRALIKMLAPQQHDSYQSWYTAEIHTDFMNLRRFRIEDSGRHSRVPRPRE